MSKILYKFSNILCFVRYRSVVGDFNVVMEKHRRILNLLSIKMASNEIYA